MDTDRTYYVVPFFLNGQLEDLNVYENEEDASNDVESWISTGNDGRHPNTFVDQWPFGGTGIYEVGIKRTQQWHELKTRCGALEDTIVQWLREDPLNVWSNVIATITSSSLTDVYEALLRARRVRRVIITNTVETDLGPICEVRLPWVDDRIIWALFDTPDAIWSDEIASITGDVLSEVHAELENLRVIEVVEVLERRPVASGHLLRVRLRPEERDRLMKREWWNPRLNGT